MYLPTVGKNRVEQLFVWSSDVKVFTFFFVDDPLLFVTTLNIQNHLCTVGKV